jgi:hypothetical protein
MIELAREFSKYKGKLRRGLWTAHETGTMVGSAWFVDRHWGQAAQACLRLSADRSARLRRHYEALGHLIKR